MDMSTLIIVGVLALIVVVAALFVLRRSWGNFPDQARMPPTVPDEPFSLSDLGLSDAERARSVQPEPGQSQQRQQKPFSLEDLGLSDAELAEQEREEADAARLVLITQPMVRRAAQQALQRGGPQAKYFVSVGDQIYFSFEAIEDPAERQAAYDLMRRVQAGEDVDFRAVMALISKLSKG